MVADPRKAGETTASSRRAFSTRRRRLRSCLASIRLRPPQAVQSPPATYPNVLRRLKRMASDKCPFLVSMVEICRLPHIRSFPAQSVKTRKKTAVKGDLQVQTGSSRSHRATKILRDTLCAFGSSPPSPPHTESLHGGIPVRRRTQFACPEFNGKSRLRDGAGDPWVSGGCGALCPHSVAGWREPDDVMFRASALCKGTTSWNLPLAVNSGGAWLSRTATSSRPLSRNTRFTDSMTS